MEEPLTTEGYPSVQNGGEETVDDLHPNVMNGRELHAHQEMQEDLPPTQTSQQEINIELPPETAQA